jgi:branched-chain amino acid transport system ATP-binding protein
LKPLLAIENVIKDFGGLRAVDGFTASLNRGEILGLIGPNGAGKTTIFNLLSGYHAPTEGKIFFEGHILNNKKPSRITRLGIARTFQNIRLFPDLTVLENVMLAFHCRMRSSFIAATLRLPGYLREERTMHEGALKLLAEVDLLDQSEELAANLPYGHQRRLEIARALGTRPKLLLLDEPAAGMNPNETRDLMELIRKVKKEFNLTVFLIEHDMKFVMEICERIIVLDFGVVIAEGPPHVIQNDSRVIEAYLGDSRIGKQGQAKKD